ncbi:YczE/YyaS/YitT family protein [Streptomyces violaceusniger]|uniref:Membrane protein n=1 Tax=Streptomyces violaceusniger TaxID=68280 RepID=A0A4D4LH47_STRVO|nr:membrane protein [Streptomyces violaceusniger]
MPANHRRRYQTYLLYLAGCLVFASGAYLFIHADLGTDPLDVFALGLKEHITITVGLAQAGVAVLCLGGEALWNRRRPLLAPMFTFFFCGSVIDVLLWADPGRWMKIGSPALVALATLLCAYGSALIIMSDFGVRPIDVLAIAMVHKWRWPFWCAKGLIEVGLMTIGFVLGGPVGIGTVCFLAGVDLLIQPFIRTNVRYLRLPNLGFPERAPQPDSSA